MFTFVQTMEGPASEIPAHSGGSVAAMRFFTKAMELPLVPTITGEDSTVVP